MGKDSSNPLSLPVPSPDATLPHGTVLEDGGLHLPVKDLREIERKALRDLKLKIEECIKNGTFLSLPSAAGPSPPLPRTVDDDADADDDDDDDDDALVAEEQGSGFEGKKANREAADASREGKEAEYEDKGINQDEQDDCVEKEAICEEKEVLTIASLSSSTTTIIEASSSSSSAIPSYSCTPFVEKPVFKEDDSSEKIDTSSSATAPGVESVKDDGTPVDKDRGDDPSSTLEDLTLWGVPLLHSKGDERTDVILLKFLRARDFKVEDAMAMLEGTLAWRKQFEADKLIEEEIHTEFDNVVAYMHGVDKEGHPVCYNHYGIFQDKELYQRVIGSEDEFRRFLRWRIRVLEHGIRKLDFKPSGVNAMVQVTDLHGSPGFIRRRNITRAALSLLQDNYPELVAKQIFINVPWYFGALYSLYGKIITPRSKSKVVVARPDKVTETLFKYISPENVPLRYGGFSRNDDTEFESVEASVKEASVKPGKCRTIEIDVATGGSKIVWDIVVVGWEVVYGEEFVPNDQESYTMTIRKPKKVQAEEEAMRNSFLASEAGKVLLTIDNATSRKTKLVVFRHTTC